MDDTEHNTYPDEQEDSSSRSKPGPGSAPYVTWGRFTTLETVGLETIFKYENRANIQFVC